MTLDPEAQAWQDEDRLNASIAQLEEDIAETEGWLEHVSWRKKEGALLVQAAAAERHLVRMRRQLEELKA